MDFLIRRTGRLYFDIDSIRKYLEKVADECASFLKTDAKTRAGWISEMEMALHQHSAFIL
jgi:glycerol-3-phosphate dehydrogenase